MRRLVFALALMLFAPAAAADRPVVVELFTSQGCSSCPPADKFMEELAATPGIVALTFPVDIWDYLGWRDSFAQAAFTERQKAYAPLLPSRSVYTPQMVIGGSADMVGSRRDDALALIRTVGAPANPGADLALALEGETLSATLTAPESLAGTPATVWLARVLSRSEVAIGDGENRGKSIIYSNIVREMTAIGTWDGTTGARFTAPVAAPGAPPHDRLAILVQKNRQGAVLAAGLIDAPPTVTAGVP